ncbi:two-component system sensor histidine kinase NtrB [Massilia sp. S19_KUP03_FR1]|uniref:two-component system sensor histidine kinase NtrB n=1 Tax=Massilia sp. S19_KUP03_FR1 TaxID=3025503 RepID=UPI002FCDAB90
MISRLQAFTPASRASFWRSLQTLNITRIVIALVLLAYMTIDARGLRAGVAPVYAQTCVAYSLMALLFAAVTTYRRRHFLLQLSIQIALDIAAISLLYMTAGGVRSGMGILYLFPLAAAAVLAPLVLALFSAALAALFVLGDSVYRILSDDPDSGIVRAGLYGAAFMVVALVVNRLAARLIGQEDLAARHGADLRSQQAINRIVIADVGDGILVVGRDGRVFTSNPAARRMMGIESDEGAGFGSPGQMLLTDVRALAPMAQAFANWLRAPAGAATAFVSVKPYDDDAGSAWRGRRDAPVHLKLRFARVEAADAFDIASDPGLHGDSLDRCVIFMHDVSAIENQAQQLKLASMGRLTASIAHEVRNPLSAIGHATALLAEDLPGKAEQRLLKIVADNVARVNRMVEDILQLSRKVQPNGQPVQLDVFLAELKAEFDETHALGSDVVWIGAVATGSVSEVRFDALHLREVVVNLLNNATRYASKTPGSIRLFALPNRAGNMELHVQDDGPGITAEVRAHLFEPFYTTSSKGTGLGLYLARELCLNNRAMLDYEFRFDVAHAAGEPRCASGRFVITFAAPNRPDRSLLNNPPTERAP